MPRLVDLIYPSHVMLLFALANEWWKTQAREGPVQFEKDAANDPFNVDKFLSEVDQNSSSKREYGLQQEEDSRQSKRARVDEDD